MTAPDTRAQALRTGGAAADDQMSERPPGATALPCQQATAWIEIRLVGEDGKGIADERYEVTLPDGTVRAGKLDAEGRVRLDGIREGQCRVTFPALDADAWEAGAA